MILICWLVSPKKKKNSCSKQTELSICILSQTFSFVEHAEAHPTPESPKAETKPNEVGGGDNEFHPASFPNELEGDEKSTESHLEETVLGANSNQLERQTSFKKG